ncbi:MAG: TonB family protein [Acidobacteria bacterium]|nr:TonB family protein [Acidobacteriota bacterium]
MYRSALGFSSLVLTLFAFSAFAQQSAHPGIDLYNAGKFREAAVSLESATRQKETKDNFEIWNYLGRSYVGLTDNKKAQKAFEKAIKLAPARADLHLNLAHVHILMRRGKQARSSANQAISLEPRNTGGYYLRGVAYFWDGDLKNSEADASKTIEINPAFGPGYVLQADIQIARLTRRVDNGSKPEDEIGFLRDATEILRIGEEKSKGHPSYEQVVEALESTSAIYEYFSKFGATRSSEPVQPEPGDEPLRIIERPRPSYTDSARSAGVQGTVILAVVFGASGRVEHILILKRLPNGLSEQARIAAKKIQFEPAKKNGIPVSVVRLVEYTFSIYSPYMGRN